MGQLILPDWPVPAKVKSLMTTRQGGVSLPPWDSFNLGDHVGDDPHHVAANRSHLGQALPADPQWLKQVHSARVVEPGFDANLEADAAFTRSPQTVCAVLTADCLPVLFCDRAGSVIAAAHAGWRGLAGGVLEATVTAMGAAPGDILAWMGAAIGPQAFEVGDELRQAFVGQNPETAGAFTPLPSAGASAQKWLADIYQLARLRLNRAGVTSIYGGGRCTYGEPGEFFSYRRDGVTGRMAALIWLE